MRTLRESFRPLLSTDLRDFTASVSGSSANRKSKGASDDHPSVSARRSPRIWIFRSGGVQQNVQGGCRCVARKVAERSCAPEKIYRARPFFRRMLLSSDEPCLRSRL